MKSITVSELKAHLSRYSRWRRQGHASLSGIAIDPSRGSSRRTLRAPTASPATPMAALSTRASGERDVTAVPFRGPVRRVRCHDCPVATWPVAQVFR